MSGEDNLLRNEYASQLSEKAFSILTNLPMNDLKRVGDGGVDFQVGRYRIDIKSTYRGDKPIDNVNLMISNETIKRHGLRSDVYVQAAVTNTHVIFMGWLPASDFMALCHETNFAGCSMRVYRDYLLDMYLLIERIMGITGGCLIHHIEDLRRLKLVA